MSDPDLSNSIGPWFQFSDELRINALDLLNQPTLELGDAGLAQPKVFAAALLARTITNHKAVLMLLRAGLITEARTLTRSCLENVLWMRRIKAEVWSSSRPFWTTRARLTSPLPRRCCQQPGSFPRRTKVIFKDTQ